MYKMSVYNNNVETVTHYPSANQDDPHVNKLPLKEALSTVDTLSFTLYPNNQGYNNVSELSTKVKVFDLRDNTVRFTGRVLDVNNKMDSSGSVCKEVTCEGALGFLNDTKLRGSTIYGDTVTSFLTQVLNIHNSKVEASKHIYVGTINIPGNVTHTCEFKTTLAEILIVRDAIGGNIRVRETNGILYMDWLQSFSSTTLEVSLGVNMKDMIIGKDITSLGTRIIPLGANNLTIETVNGGLDYLEDSGAKAIYGVIEKTVEYKDVEDAATLRTMAIDDLSNHTQPSYILTSNALDLSYLTGNKAEQFFLGTKLHLLNRFMGVDATYSIVGLDLDLLQPYNPNLTISQKPITLSDAINDLRKSSIQNDGVYNNVQIGRSFGIRATSSDGKSVTTMNATDGIKIQTDRGSGLVDSFYVDTNGNLKINTYDEITGQLTSAIDLNNTKISAIVQTDDGGASWELNKNAFIVAFNEAGSGYTEINENGITVYDGRFKIKKDGDTKFYVNTNGKCNADGGFVVDDGNTKCNIDSAGITMTNDNGYTSGIYVDQNSTTLMADNDLAVLGTLRTQGSLRAIGYMHCYDVVDMDSSLYVDADLDVTGTKNCLQDTSNYGYRRINAYETAEYYFGDIGSGVIRNGECIVFIDDVFSECVNTEMEYQVEIFEYVNRGSIKSIERYPNYFVVKGDIDNIEFGWEMKAKRKSYENNRLEFKPDKNNASTLDSENTLLTNNVPDNTTYLLENNNQNLDDILLEEVV